ncbi:MAG: O-antigen ligase family protein [Prolixibacteraceae bacterium]
MIKKDHLYLLLGFLWNLDYLLGVFNIGIQGIFVLYAFICLLLFLLNDDLRARCHPTKGLLMILVFLIPVLLVPLHPFSEYAGYKSFFFLVKCGTIAFLPLLLKERILLFVKGYWIACMVFLSLVFLRSLPMITEVSVNNRIEIGHLNPIWISRLVMEGLLLTIIVFRKSRLALIYFLGSLIVFYVSGSKGPFVSGLLILAFYFIRSRKISFKYLIPAFMVTVMLLGAGYRTLTTNTYIQQRFLRLVPENASKKIVEKSRIVVWPKSVEKISETPFRRLLTGYGFGNYSEFYPGKPIFRFYPHNLILELLIECGLLYLFLFAVFIYAFHYKNMFSWLFWYSLLNAMFSGDILLNERLFLYLSLMYVYQLYPTGEIAEPAGPEDTKNPDHDQTKDSLSYL